MKKNIKLLQTILIISSAIFISVNTHSQETRTFTDYYGDVEIPTHPQRIVSLQDHGLIMALVELNAPVVGSVGRVADNGTLYLRGVKDLLGVDFHNSEIEYVGWIDFEKVVAVKPDLIITNQWEEAADLEKLRKIAPTVAIDQSKPLLASMRDIADASGVLNAYDDRLTRYQTRLVEAKKIIPNASEITVSVVLAGKGTLRGYKNYGALTQVLNDIGFKQPDAVMELEDAAEFSAEVIQELDGDFVIDTYRISRGDTPALARERLAEIIPSWCSLWHACRNNQYLVFPRTFVYSSSFTSLELVTQLLVTHIGGREFISIEGS